MAKKLYEEQHIQNIADAIREKNGTETKYKLSEMGDAVRELGQGEGDSYYDIFWDSYQLNGERTRYNNAFECHIGTKVENYEPYPYWNKDNFKPKYDLKPTHAAYMFQYFGAGEEDIDLEALLKECGVVLDFSNLAETIALYVFGNVYISTIPELDFGETVTTLDRIFRNSRVKTIRKLVMRATYKFNDLFYGCVLLEDVTIEGVIANSISFAGCPNLSDASIQSIIDGLADLTGSDTQTLTFHADVKAKLTEEQIATITNKNWTLA